MKFSIILIGAAFGAMVLSAALADPAVQPADVTNMTVALDGSGDFRSVQAAIDAAPEHSATRITIHLKPGTYKERLNFPKEKPFIALVGENAATTILTFNNTHNTTGPDGNPIGTSKSASAFIYGDDFLADNVTFENSAGAVGQAVAINIIGDRAEFLNCRFIGWQDTVETHGNREYFHDCYISGAIDFIFGAATAYFKNCEIHTRGPGSLTAASTTQADPYGYVFDHCKITSEAPKNSVALGRPWRAYGATVYLSTSMPDSVKPGGWDDWGKASTARFAEYDSTGPGAAPDKRVAWSHQLGADQAKQITVENVLGGDDHWNPEALPAIPTADAAPAPQAIPYPMPKDLAVPLPDIPDRKFSIVDSGAVPDGKTLNTDAINKAIAACTSAGGGTVDVPQGIFLTAPFTLASNLNLHLEKGATILFTDKIADLKVNDKGFENLISARDCHDVAITGPGTIDGQGSFYWKNYVQPKTGPANPELPHRPRMIELDRCMRVLVQDVTLKNSPSFHLVPSQCQNVTIEGIHIKSPWPSPNTDGIDPSGANYLITRCTIDTGDDNIAVKASSRYDPARPSCENFLITDCTFLHGHGMSVGSESYGGLRNMTVRNCTFDGTETAIRLKSPRGRGGLVENIVYENLTMKGVKTAILISSYYPKIPDRADQETPRQVSIGTPIWRNIRITNVTATGVTNAGQIVGLPEMPVQDLVLDHVQISAKKPIEIVNANGVRFVDCNISASSDHPVIFNSKVEGLE